MAAGLVPQPRLSRPASLSGLAAGSFGRMLPGLGVCLLVTGAAVLLADLERRLFGAVWLEGLVLAIVVGAAVRTAWTPARSCPEQVSRRGDPPVAQMRLA